MRELDIETKEFEDDEELASVMYVALGYKVAETKKLADAPVEREELVFS